MLCGSFLKSLKKHPYSRDTGSLVNYTNFNHVVQVVTNETILFQCQNPVY